ncbi:MAG: Na+/H+ antiporter subunit G [Pseudomonadota bacterium]
MSFIQELVLSIFLVIGGIFILVGSIGLIRLRDFYTRLHAPTKATTVGLGSLLFGTMFYQYFTQGKLSVSELLITLFLVITAPVVAHMLAKVAMHYQVQMMIDTKNQHHVKTARDQQPPSEKS